MLAHTIPPADDPADANARGRQISLGVTLIHVRVMPIGVPLFHIASHLENAVGRTSARECVHRTRSLAWTVIAPPAKPFGVPVITPWKNATVGTTRGFLPFDLGREPQPGPFAVGLRAEPSDVDHGVPLKT